MKSRHLLLDAAIFAFGCDESQEAQTVRQFLLADADTRLELVCPGVEIDEAEFLKFEEETRGVTVGKTMTKPLSDDEAAITAHYQTPDGNQSEYKTAVRRVDERWCVDWVPPQ